MYVRYAWFPGCRVGALGEELAGRYLRLRGYAIIEQNYRLKLGEVDFIAREKTELVFIEVKTRSATAFGAPDEAITDAKRLHISRVALAYLKQRGLLREKARFDVVSIILERKRPLARIRLIQNAFSLSRPYSY
ncbi:MAG: YraN family protein [Candidatus Omnitrophica bacterium]|nr:YraN family protein [Candidatus Omnitrophota bacterium]